MEWYTNDYKSRQIITRKEINTKNCHFSASTFLRGRGSNFMGQIKTIAVKREKKLHN